MTQPSITHEKGHKMMTAETHEIPSTRLQCARHVACAGEYVACKRYEATVAGGHVACAAQPIGYRERAAQLRALDTHRCEEHGDLAVFCGCRP